MCCCFSGEPIEGDDRAFRPDAFQISMLQALYKNQPCCCISCLCPCCSTIYTRCDVLEQDMGRYSCCQGYFDNQCCHAGCCYEQSCPEFCLCVEAFCCVGPSMSASRLYVMDQHNLRPDPVDNQIVRFSNCLQILACVCHLLAIVFDPLKDLAQCVQLIADCVFYTTLGCMASQVNNELKYRRSEGAGLAYQGVPATVAQPSSMEGDAIYVKENHY